MQEPNEQEKEAEEEEQRPQDPPALETRES